MNGKCYCGAPNCIKTLFPRIIRDDQESGDEGGNEAEGERLDAEQRDEGGKEAGGKGDEVAGEIRETADGDDMHLNT